MRFDQTYNQEDFLQFLETFLPEDFVKKEEDIVIKKDRYKEINKAKVLGFCESLDLHVLEMNHGRENDPRITIATDAFKILADHWIHRALVIFKSKNSDNFRFSFLKITLDLGSRNNVIKKYSNAKRHSFYLGPGAKVNTPTRYLIKNGKVINFIDLESRFSLEVVNKEFYKQISDNFTKLVGGTLGSGKNKKMHKAILTLPSVPDQNRVSLEFAVRLIGRVIFCWFLREKKSPTGIPLMPKELLSLEAVAKHPDYYHQILESIFFEVLNKETKSRGESYSNTSFSLIPYLNGGLFSPHEDDYYKRRNGEQSLHHNTLVIPDEWFEDFFKTLETYNFTIDENTSFDEELSIDPEMLGRIFENLLAEINPETGESARKSTGSYYTPRAIVDYMIDESLLLYLKKQTNIAEKILRAIISYDLADDSQYSLNQNEKQEIIDSLERLKLLDPTCGSGAFPIGALQKIVFILQQIDQDGQLWFKTQIQKASPEIRRVIEREFSHRNFDYIRKLGVIRENIYGVDIQPIATEISRLRCFLTLVVDERVDDSLANRGIEPLPNLDFKFVTANSLIGLPSNQQATLFKDQAGIDQLKDLRNQFFNATNSERYQLKDEFKEIQKKMLLRMIETRGGDDITQKLSAWDPFNNKASSWFDPEWMFGINSGFDIVIANPPYIGEKGHKNLFREVKNKKYKLADFYLGKMDLFYFFFHLALNLSKEDSEVAFITTNYYTTALGARKLRRDLKQRAIIRNLVNFNELKIFEAATGQHNMITILQKSQNENSVAKTCITQRQGLAKSEILRQILNGNDPETHYYQVKQNDLYDGEECYIRLVGNLEHLENPIQRILDKVKKQGELLGVLSNVNNGIFAGADTLSELKKIKYKINNANIGDGIFVLTKEEVDNLNLDNNEKRTIMPLFKNSDIHRYSTNNKNDLFILNLRYTDRPNIDNYPNIKNHLIRFKNLLSNRPRTGTLESAFNNGYWYVMSTSRRVSMDTEKIVVPQRSSTNTFGYNNIPWYAMSDVFFITERDKSISLKYILALINSKLYYLWLYHRGKRKGETLELIGNPISEIPIKKISITEQKRFIDVVDRILEITLTLGYNPKNPPEEQKILEREIDQFVYKLYGLTEDEIMIVDN
jgi:adenine-specific DNA-methyltransferase